MSYDQFEKAKNGSGFIAALDQSGGSTPKALKLYGIEENAYSNDAEMFDLVHQMRTRIITSPAFDGDRIMGAILFEDTMDRTIEDRHTADYLWNVKHVVPFLKVDKGLADEEHGAQVMKPIPGLDELLARARDNGVFGTKMRSFIKLPGAGLDAVVAQQFEIGRQIIAAGLVPIIEPEVDIHSPRKAEAEDQLLAAILEAVNQLDDDQSVMVKLTLPDTETCTTFVDHPRWSASSRCPAATAAMRPAKARAQQRRHRQLLPGADGGTHRCAERSGVQRDTGCGDRRDRKGVKYLRRVRAWCARSARRSWTGVRRWRAPNRAAGRRWCSARRCRPRADRP